MVRVDCSMMKTNCYDEGSKEDSPQRHRDTEKKEKDWAFAGMTGGKANLAVQGNENSKAVYGMLH